MNKDANFEEAVAVITAKLTVLVLRNVLNRIQIRTNKSRVIVCTMEMVHDRQRLTSEFFIDRMEKTVLPPLDIILHMVCNYLHQLYLESDHPALHPETL